MAWTAPKTWSSGDVLTAADMNTYVRDNTNETAPGKAAAAGDLFYATSSTAITPLTKGTASDFLVQGGSNAPVWRSPTEDFLDESDVFTDTAFADLDALSPSGFSRAVTVTVTTGTTALVVLGPSLLANDTAAQTVWLGFRVSGATTLASNEDRAIGYEVDVGDGKAQFGAAILLDTLNAGSNVFELQAKTTANNGQVSRPRLAVIPF